MQVFVGRVAMIGFASAILGEIQTGGKGPLGQLALPIQTPLNSQVAGSGRHHESTVNTSEQVSIRICQLCRISCSKLQLLHQLQCHLWVQFLIWFHSPEVGVMHVCGRQPAKLQCLSNKHQIHAAEHADCVCLLQVLVWQFGLGSHCLLQLAWVTLVRRKVERTYTKTKCSNAS